MSKDISSTEALAAKARQRAANAPPGSDDAERSLGLVAGLTSQVGATVASSDPAGSMRYRAGYLGGNLAANLILLRGSIRPDLFMAAIAYGSALATPEGQRALLAAPDPVNAHTYACVLAHKHGAVIDERDEADIFTWLVRLRQVTPTAELTARYERMRARRLQRLGPA